MRIVHITDGYLPRLGGIETQVHDLAFAQRASGHDVEIITTTAPCASADDLVVHRASIGLGADRAMDGGYDVVHVHLSIASPLGLSVLWRAADAGRPVIATMHSLWGPAEPLLTGAKRVLGARAGSVEWSAVSHAAADPLRRSLGVPVAVVPNGVDVAWWAQVDRAPDPDGVRALSVMRLCRRKRPLPLLRTMGAAVDAASTARRVTLTVVGDGRLSSQVRRSGRRLRQLDVAVTGRLTRVGVRQLMRAHDFYVAPAPLESFGLAALEARSAGLPVVAFRRSGVADFIRDGRDGLLVDDEAGLRDAVAQLVQRPELLRRLQSTARTHRPELGWPVTLTGYADLYDRARTRRAELLGLRHGTQAMA